MMANLNQFIFRDVSVYTECAGAARLIWMAGWRHALLTQKKRQLPLTVPVTSLRQLDGGLPGGGEATWSSANFIEPAHDAFSDRQQKILRPSGVGQ
jgi:hypothetical protein